MNKIKTNCIDCGQFKYEHEYSMQFYPELQEYRRSRRCKACEKKRKPLNFSNFDV